MDGVAIKSETTDAIATQHASKVFWTNAKRKIDSIINSICKIAPHHDLDAYERQQIETLVDALNCAEQIRRKSQYLK
jgi:hypothetical protein